MPSVILKIRGSLISLGGGGGGGGACGFSGRGGGVGGSKFSNLMIGWPG